MPVIKHEYPILEYDTQKHGVIRPDRNSGADGPKLPEICVMTFFGEVLDAFVMEQNAEVISKYKSEMSDFHIYRVEYKNVEMCIVQAVVGSASAAMMMDFIIGNGVKKVIACGGCGVLKDIPAGDVIVPVCAMRDEGASYHYLPPTRNIEIDRDMVLAIESVLDKRNIPFVECKTWTTDGLYRETPDMIEYRKEEGCSVVEMECATFAAVARFRGAKFGQLLYSGDILTDFDNYDERDWTGNITARQKLFMLALESALQA